MTVTARIEDRVAQRRRSPRWTRFIVVLRMLLGFAFLPAGLKKVLGQPFADPDLVGPFYTFLDAFHGTGAFYRAVGALQLVAAALLLTQRRATLGAALLTPVLTAIFVFCWSTGVIFTASVVTLMMLGLAVLLLWDVAVFRPLWSPGAAVAAAPEKAPAGIKPALWERCGWVILALYVGHTALTGEVYRPRGAEWHNPSFYVLLAVAAAPLITWRIERRVFRAAR